MLPTGSRLKAALFSLFLLFSAASTLDAQYCFQFASQAPAATVKVQIGALPNPPSSSYFFEASAANTLVMTVGSKTYTAVSFNVAQYPSAFLYTISFLGKTSDGTLFGASLGGPPGILPGAGLPTNLPSLNQWYAEITNLFVSPGGVSGDPYPITSIATCTVSGGGSGGIALSPVTFATTPPGLALTIDSLTLETPRALTWTTGTSHTLSAPSPQVKDGKGYTFLNWFTGGAQTQTVVAGANPTYIANFSLVPTPVIQAVENAASSQPGFSSATWVAIRGANLAATTRVWTGADFSGANLPTVLDGVRVTLNGRPAYVYYVSPTQVNVLAPDDTATGPVKVQITNAAGLSNEFSVTKQATMPALFLYSQLGGRYAVALDAISYAYVAPSNLAAGVVSAPAKPGQLITLYATGLGATSPSFPAGQLVPTFANLTTPATVKIGGQNAVVSFGGLVSSGLYQLNVTVPALADGDAEVILSTGPTSSPSGVYLAVKK